MRTVCGSEFLSAGAEFNSIHQTAPCFGVSLHQQLHGAELARGRKLVEKYFASARASEVGGYAGYLTPQLFMWGILICIYPLENLIPSHANCMQHVLRCCERQSDGSVYKKTLRRPGLRPGPC